MVNKIQPERSKCSDEMIEFTNTKHGDVCPANWKEGEEGMKPTQEGVSSYLGKRG